jgi:hypothetical protein
MLVAYGPDAKRRARLGSRSCTASKPRFPPSSIAATARLQFLSYQEAGWPERLMDGTRKTRSRLGFAHRLTNGAAPPSSWRLPYLLLPDRCRPGATAAHERAQPPRTNYSAVNSGVPDGISTTASFGADNHAGENGGDAIPTNDASFIARGEVKQLFCQGTARHRVQTGT